MKAISEILGEKRFDDWQKAKRHAKSLLDKGHISKREYQRIADQAERSESGQDKSKPTVKSKTFPNWESAIDHAWKLVKTGQISMTEFRSL